MKTAELKKTNLIFSDKNPEIIKDENYPTFTPSKYITFINEGYLNGGSYVPRGTVMKLVNVKKEEKVLYVYQGILKLHRVDFGFKNFSNDDVIQKQIYGAEQFLRLKGSWFNSSNNGEARQLKKAINIKS